MGVFFAAGVVSRGGLQADLTGLRPFALQETAYAQTTPSTPEIEFEPIPVDPGNRSPAPNSVPSEPSTSETSTPTDTASPQIPISLVGSLPQKDATDVSVDSRIELQFSDRLDDALEELELRVEPEIGLQFNVSGDRLLLEPSEALEFSTDYELTLASQAAIPLAEDVVLAFRTEPEYTYDIDIEPLLHMSCVGCHGATGRLQESNSLMDTYAGVLRYVEPGNGNSPLIDPKYTRPHARRFPASTSLAQRFMRLNAYPLEKLGSWTPEEIEIVTTWVVQDEAIETSASRQARLAADS